MNCLCILKTGINKGKQCSNKATNPTLCGIHYQKCTKQNNQKFTTITSDNTKYVNWSSITSDISLITNIFKFMECNDIIRAFFIQIRTLI